MTTTTAPAPSTSTTTTTTRGAATAYSVLIDLVVLAIVSLAVFAGAFLRADGQRDAYRTSIDIHGRIADVAIGLTILAAIVAFAKIRHRKDLVVGTSVLAVALVVNGYLGGLIVDHGKDSLTIVHVPLAMSIMGLSVWLLVKGIALRKATTGNS